MRLQLQGIIFFINSKVDKKKNKNNKNENGSKNSSNSSIKSNRGAVNGRPAPLLEPGR
jgi:hypothetical protein